VTKLPALPDRLRTNVTGLSTKYLPYAVTILIHVLGRQHGAIYSDSGYALTLTHSHALVWPYAINIQSPETFTFSLPYPSKFTHDPLPLGSLVSASASSSEPGLVVVIPTTGKITYWESVASAATLDLHPQRHGVELTIQGMHSGETVVQLLNAESAGFVLAFSSGRVAYMSVRDGQGRPAISVQFLRGGTGTISGGIFGSIRNVLSASALRGDIAAVRAGRADRVGERSVLVASAKGKLQAWNLHRGGHNSIEAEAESREAIVMAIKQQQPALDGLAADSFEILDFTYTPKSIGNTQLSNRDEEGTHLLLLTSLMDRQTCHYSLVEVVLQQNELLIGSIRPIKSYTTPVNREAISKPRLYLPNPALVAYAVFERAVVVMSMAKQPESPELQLRSESHILPQTFEDVIDFRAEMSVDIVGSGLEEPHGPSHGIEDSKSRRFKAKHPAVVLIIRGGGVVRVAATNINKLISAGPQQVTAKSKLEQAVFFSTLEHNPISFAVRPELQFPTEELGAAALELSLEILKSQTPYIPVVPASIAENLRKRSSALRVLAEYLRDTGVDLDRVTRWKLLWDAERMEAATVVWKNYDAGIRRKPQGEKRGVLTDIVEFIHENYKTEPVAEAGELDRVRHWFINDIWNLETAVPWAYQVIRETFGAGQKDHGFVMKMLAEADEMVIGALEGAFNFRIANMELYGLQAEQLEHGILKQGYEGLPEFWTSALHIVNNLRKQTELAGVLLKEYWNKPPKSNIDPDVVDQIRSELPRVIDLAIRSSVERIRWDSAQNSPELQIEAENLKKQQTIAQDDRIQMLAGDLELSDQAIALAEKYQIMPTLAHVLMLELYLCGKRMERPGMDGSEFNRLLQRSQDLNYQIHSLFAKYGETWATALYEKLIEFGYLNNLLNLHQDQQKFLTAFLRSKPEYAKLSWLQEVTREKNFDQAAKTLLDLGLKREQDLWSKKIELSIGKMARLADRNYSQSNAPLIPDWGQTELAVVNNQLGLVKIQDQVYDYVLPSIEAAIDPHAELQLALEAHSDKGLRNKIALSLLLESSMSKLVKHEAMEASSLIDLLTLMAQSGNSEEEFAFRGEQFYLAIRASLQGIPKKDQQYLAQQVIWRRCMLRDDWADLNNTVLKDDQQVDDQLRTTALYMAYKACFKNRKYIRLVFP
jgi:nuclear pore complex protein Nup133